MKPTRIMNTERIAVGIDLGTTTSCMAIYHPDEQRAEYLCSNAGKNIIPSYIAFLDNERKIGAEAKNEVASNPDRVIYDVKRLIGRKFDEKEVQKDIQNWKFQVVKDPNSERPQIIVDIKGSKEIFSPEEVSGFFLNKLKAQCEEQKLHSKKITDVVITVPARFNSSQRRATKDAAEIAQLNVIGMINEPTAAAIAYKVGDKENKKILVFDLGGGTFDISILEVKDEKLVVLATGGDTHLGGRDFDRRLFDYAVKKVEKEQHITLSDSVKARLKANCEEQKIVLSSYNNATINVEYDLSKNKTYQIKISRANFNRLCDDLFQRCIKLLDETIKDAGLTKDDIEDYILVGGSTRMPELKNMVYNYFGKETNVKLKDFNPDEIVAKGASIYASQLIQGGKTSALEFQDIVPLNLGTDVSDGSLSVIVKRFERIPFESSQDFVTCNDNQSAIGIAIYEGLDLNVASNNNLLGEYTITGLTPMPRGQCKVRITLKMNKEDNLLISEAYELTEGKKNEASYKVKNNGLLSPRSKSKLIAKAKAYLEEDIKEDNLSEVISELNELFDENEFEIDTTDENDPSNKQKLDKLNRISRKIKSIKDFLKENPNEATLGQYQKWIGDLKRMKQEN